MELLSLEEIQAIEATTAPQGGYPPPEQFGPLRRVDPAGLCTHSSNVNGRNYNCHSQTHYKVQGKHRCMVHALNELNQMLIDRGVDS